MKNNRLLTSALYYAQLNWRVFPIVPRNKQPLILGWRTRATTNPKHIKAWWGIHPTANIGVATGAESGIFVLDIDTDKHGDWSLQGLERLYEELPLTIASFTGNGGKHLFFLHPGQLIRNSVCKLGHGLDVRGDGGYVLAPPSQHPNGRAYQWISPPWLAQLASFPMRLIKKLAPTAHQSSKRGFRNTNQGKEEGVFWVNQALRQVHSGGGRNDTCFWLACQLRDWGFSEDAAWRHIKAYAKRVPAGTHPFTLPEAQRAWENAFSTSRRCPATRALA